MKLDPQQSTNTRGFTNRDLTARAVNTILSSVQCEHSFSIVRDINRAKRYVRGDQYVVPNLDRITTSAELLPIRSRNAAKVMNILRPFEHKFQSVISQHIPGVKVTAKDTSSALSLKAADVAQAYIQSWISDREFLKNEIPKIVNRIWDSGTVYANIFIRKSGFNIKVDEVIGEGPEGEPILFSDLVDAANDPEVIDITAMSDDQLQEVKSAEDQSRNDGFANRPRVTPQSFGLDGIPDTLDDDLDTIEIPGYEPDVYITSGLEVTIPEGTDKIDDKTPWLRFDKSWHIGEIIEEYGSDAVFLAPSRNDEPEYQRSHDLPSVNLNTKVAVDHLNLRTQNLEVVTKLWINSINYNLLRREEREIFHNFPYGAVLHIVNGKLLRITSGVIKEDWVAILPDKGEVVQQPPEVTDSITGQIVLNDSINMAEKHLTKGIPKTIVDGRLLSQKQIEDSNSKPWDVIRSNANALTGDMSRMVATIPTASFPNELMGYLTFILEMTKDGNGLRDTIFGGGPPTQTYREAQQRRDGALGQLAPFFSNIAIGIKDIYTAVISKAAKFGIGYFEHNRKRYSIHTDLSSNGWVVNVSEGIASSELESKDSLTSILQMGNPEIIQGLELFSPLNRQRIYSILGIPGFTSTGAEDVGYADTVLDELLAGTPILDPETGSVTSSVAPDMELESPDFMINYMKSWAKRVDGGVSVKRTNPGGYQNVLLYVKEYMAMSQQPGPSQGPGPGPGPGPGSNPDQPPTVDSDQQQDMPPQGPQPGPQPEAPAMVQ